MFLFFVLVKKLWLNIWFLNEKSLLNGMNYVLKNLRLIKIIFVNVF